eukprot:CAMPEP_0174295330 /NCGR_PEP_ID=MMETSP0809-20121228/44415_1 /TAXON_ID=73025 ORGANISM="Eutreptiella gymnastica-like, Strain CCMP1594" /NCGR_SAMPLE_ID=MMETSP0809 /ASSEMBLY_ACC=CAM_ASM_000658 /LENGTH=55 /DNA_ID=CAMNT_0015397527 /DNA_START=184 /DNA_END=351 /DNA_ORIENTATION=+
MSKGVPQWHHSPLWACGRICGGAWYRPHVTAAEHVPAVCATVMRDPHGVSQNVRR